MRRRPGGLFKGVQGLCGRFGYAQFPCEPAFRSFGYQPMTTDPRIVYEFGPFRMDPDKQVLLRENQPIPVTPKAFETLLALVRRSRDVVTKEELLKEIWPDSFVEESNLSQNIFMLRKALGDTAENRQYIVTLPGRGYRFAAPVRTVTQQGEVLVAHARARTQIVIEENEPETEQALKTVPKAALPPKTQPRKAFYYYVAAVVVLSAALAGGLFLRRLPANSPASKEWEQLTFFTDSAVYPALSPDGRMLAFIRGSDSFMGSGQIYVKLLSGGEPVQLTNDSRTKLAPTFSPDSSSIAYSVTEPWDTWEVPVLGGEPHMLMPNSSSLTWIEQGKRLLFSEFREGLHLVVVTTDEGRGSSRGDVYVPSGMRSMAHHSYLSPDGRWVLIVEMDSQTKIGPCRVVPFPAAGVPPTNEVRLVGPLHRTCIAGAWSPDGKWIYLTASEEPGGLGRAGWLLASGSHIWRQRFPDGEPEQVTFGPTSQEGIAIAPDGKSLITSVGSQDRTVWMHDKDGDHQISSEGSASSPSFSSDGRSLYFLMSNGQTHGEELWIKDLSTGKVERVLPGYPMQDYSVSRDGKEVAFTMSDQGSCSNIWVAPTSRRSSPIRISSAVAEDAPLLLPDGDLVFRATEGGVNFLYRMKTDGSARRKISPERVLDIHSISPDGRWVIAETPGSGDEEHITLGTAKAFAVDGTATVPLCTGDCLVSWDTSGGFIYFRFPQVKEGSYALPAMRDSGLPSIPPAITGIEDITNLKAITAIPWEVESAVNPSIYAYTRLNTRRNLYRIPTW
jgi:DNA-binding winged helix-turn-helix (wHTH) protein/Tol biopolymer transport system component